MVDVKFCREAPNNQNIVDIFQGLWLSSFPEEYQIQAGPIRHFDFAVDPRVKWVDSILPNGLKSLSVLELGPFEAYNTWQLEKCGAKPVIAIENNSLNYLKCLIVKEVTGISPRFLYGDFIPYLENCACLFDIVWASGVLYHQIHPLRLIELISKVTDKVFLHTHYYDKDTISRSEGLSKIFIGELDTLEKVSGFQVKLHYRTYVEDMKNVIFSGGVEDHSYWLEKDDILGGLRHFGYSGIRIGVDDIGNPSGPAMFLLAEKLAD